MSVKIKDNKFIVLLLIIGAVYFFLRVIVPISAPILIALLFVTIFGPLLQKIQSKFRIHRQIGAIILLLVACTLVGLLLWVLFSWIAGSMPGWAKELEALEASLVVIVEDVCALVGRIPGVDHIYLEELVFSNIQKGLDYFQQDFFTGVLSQSLTYIKTVGTVGVFLISFVIATVLLAKDYDAFMNKMLEREECHVILEVICGIIKYLATFIKAQVIIMSIIGSFLALVLAVSAVPHGFLWGLLAGVLDALPFIGAGIVLIPLAVQLFFQKCYLQAAVCVISYVICVFIRQGLEPKLIGEKVGVPPIMILIALYAGLQLFGFWGILGGPLGYIIIQQAVNSIFKRSENDLTNEIG